MTTIMITLRVIRKSIGLGLIFGTAFDMIVEPYLKIVIGNNN